MNDRIKHYVIQFIVFIMRSANMSELESCAALCVKKIKKFCNGTVTEITGSGSDLSQDGSSKSASFLQPTAICIEGNSIYVCDTAVC